MPIYALVDGNSFYASCQIAFQPELAKRPVVVLSNNDGCIVAANQIAKNLDSPGNLGQGGYRAATPFSMMFQPYFKVAAMLKKHNTAVFSSNYELYEDMSQRMHAISAQFSFRQEIYSIDESFLDFSGIPQSKRHSHALELKQRIQQWIGIPVAIGIGFSKTQAKLANNLAKKQANSQGVLDLTQCSELALKNLYKKAKVGKVWGVGRKLAQKLEQQEIYSAYDLKIADAKSLKRRFSINLERIILELNGQACLNFHEFPGSKQSIVSSRSFGTLVDDFALMRQAVSHYTATAAEKLRQQNSCCQAVSVFITTPPHQQNQAQYNNQYTIPLVYPSDNTVLLNKIALRALQHIWQQGFYYQKASVLLSNIKPKESLQIDLFAANPKYSANAKSDQLMQTLDKINQQMGKKTLQLASSGLENKCWTMKRNLISKRYTTCWQELLTVQAN